MKKTHFIFFGGLSFFVIAIAVFVAKRAGEEPSRDAGAIESVHENQSTLLSPQSQLSQEALSQPQSQSSTHASKSIFCGVAKIMVGGQEETFSANALGWYPPVNLQPKEVVSLHMKLAPGAKVHELSFDGGALDNRTRSQAQQADASGNLDFDYQAGESPGAYRIGVMSRGQRRIFNFWVGPPLPQRVNP